MIWTSTKKSILNSYKYHLGKGGVDWGNLILHTIHKAVSNAQYPTHTWPTSKFTENSEIWIYYTFTLHLAEAPEPREPQEPKTMNKNMNISFSSENLKYEYLLLKKHLEEAPEPREPREPQTMNRNFANLNIYKIAVMNDDFSKHAPKHIPHSRVLVSQRTL